MTPALDQNFASLPEAMAPFIVALQLRVDTWLELERRRRGVAISAETLCLNDEQFRAACTALAVAERAMAVLSELAHAVAAVPATWCDGANPGSVQ